MPQGTCMGPLCFLIFINDALHDAPHHWKYIDDYTVGVTINHTTSEYSPLQDILDHLQSWKMDNHVTIHIEKIAVMHFNTSIISKLSPALMIGFHQLQVVVY